MDSKNFEIPPVMRKADDGTGSVTKALQKLIEDKHNIKFKDYWDFQKWTVYHSAEYWAAVWDFSGVISSKKYDKVIDPNVSFSDPYEWFRGAKLNYAENILKYRDNGIALITLGEDKEVKEITYSEMYESAQLYAAAFRKCGLRKGDIVASYASNREEPVLAMAATTSIGAIWTGALPLMGSKPVLDRFQQLNPKFLISLDRFRFDGNEIEMLPNLKVIAEGLSSLKKLIIIPTKGESNLPDISDIKHSCFLQEFLNYGREEDGSVPPIKFEQVPFSHTVFINFTSGTTGLPKAIVHGCGALMAVVRDFHLHFNSRRGDIWLSMSPAGWASWNMFCSVHFLGCTIILFEGFPYYLSPTYFWNMVDELKITHLFISSSVVDELQKRGYAPTEKHSLATLKYFVSGGSVVKPKNFDFVYERVKKDVLFSSCYGCTEIMGICLAMEKNLPVHRGEIPVVDLGCDVETVDEKGNCIIGEMGEVVLNKPMPSLCDGIWNDSDGSQYRKTYLNKYPGKFAIGDFAIVNPRTKGWIICGRSDDTLNQRGCRFGSSEIYNVVDQLPEVLDSICVSKYNKDMDESAVLFLKIRDCYKFSKELVQKVKTAIAIHLTIRHVPDFILEVRDIPYNINGKKMEIVVKNIINNKPFNENTVQNPESLKYFHNVPELKLD